MTSFSPRLSLDVEPKPASVLFPTAIKAKGKDEDRKAGDVARPTLARGFPFARHSPLTMSTRNLGDTHQKIDLLETLKNRSASENESVAKRYPIVPIRELGKGGYGNVVLIQDTVKGDHVAAKVLRKDKISQEEFLRELHKTALVQGPHIVKVINFYETIDSYVIIYEVLEGTLYDTFKSMDKFPLAEIKNFLRQALRCLAELHKKGLCHHDLKMNNMSYKDGKFTLFDFGLCIDPSQENIWTYLGPLSHLAPEGTLQVDHSFAQDIFALGCIVFYLFSGEFPFDEIPTLEIEDLSGRKISGDVAKRLIHLVQLQELLGPMPEALVQSSKIAGYFYGQDSVTGASQLLYACDDTPLMGVLQTFNENRKDPETDVESLGDLLLGLMNPDHNKRLTAEAALNHPFLQDALPIRLPFPRIPQDSGTSFMRVRGIAKVEYINRDKQDRKEEPPASGPAAQDLVDDKEKEKPLPPVKGVKKKPYINPNPFIPASACRVAAEATKNSKYLKPKAPQKPKAKHPPLWIPSSSTMVAADRLKLPNIKRNE